MSTASLWLDDYNDLFSDFDSRHYSSRRVSEDFLYEVRMDIGYGQQPIEELLLLVPGDIRDLVTETTVTKRLSFFFAEQYDLWSKKYSRKFRISLLMGFFGIVLMMLDAVIVFFGIRMLAITLLSTILEPASWFLLWTSVDYLIYNLRELRRERDFYKKLTKAKVIFRNA